VHPAFNPPQQVFAAGVIQVRQLELLHVLPVALVARLCEVLGAAVDVQAVIEPIAMGVDVPARSL
jgi:hypothetical protein